MNRTLNEEKKLLVDSLEQLLTISSILAGFAFSGLLAIPALEKSLYEKFVFFMKGDLERTLYLTYYSLFMTTCFLLGTMVPVIVYKGTHYQVPLKKLKRIHLISNLLFSFGLAGLVGTVIIFGLTNTLGIFIAFTFGLFILLDFLYENIVPFRAKQRLEEIKAEELALCSKKTQAPATTVLTKEQQTPPSQENLSPS